MQSWLGGSQWICSLRSVIFLSSLSFLEQYGQHSRIKKGLVTVIEKYKKMHFCSALPRENLQICAHQSISQVFVLKGCAGASVFRLFRHGIYFQFACKHTASLKLSLPIYVNKTSVLTKIGHQDKALWQCSAQSKQSKLHSWLITVRYEQGKAQEVRPDKMMGVLITFQSCKLLLYHIINFCACFGI